MNTIPSAQRQKKVFALTGLFFSAALSLLSSGCATSAQTRTGFLTDYGRLKPIQPFSGLYAEKDAARDSGQSIHVTPVSWLVSPESSGALDDRERNGLCFFTQSELEHALQGISPTPAAGQHPLELRSAITRVETSNPALNVVTTLALFMPLNNGGICLEWKLVDPASERIIAEGVAVQTGKPWQFRASFETLGHAKAGLTKISKELASYLAISPDSRATVN